MFQKILIANRGEIAVRIIRACREMGIKTVAVYSEADRDALHAQLADEAVCIGPAAPSESYLNMERILSATVATKAEAIHPGFGFLSENSRFVEMCEKCNVTFIGPSAAVIDRMGNKSEARKTMMEAGVPVVPGTKEPVYTAEEALEAAKEIGFPVMIKASSGGGGKGMRISESEADFAENFNTAQRESVNAFADNTMYLERYVARPRHVEVQIVGDRFGNVVQLGERDCSIQRRHQKMIEESPSCAITEETRKKMGETAVLAAKTVGYESAGTIEFLLADSGEFFFMEMNTRIQVEHPVTEFVSGVDLVKEQIRVAAGLPLSVKQEEIQMNGHAIECRINAENPAKNFMPCPGTIENLYIPGGNGVRIDTAVYNGYHIPPNYDSMIMKVIVHDRDRESAIAKMRSTLGEVIIEGVQTNLDFQYDILNQKDFLEGNVTTHFIEEHYE
ncbi:MAG: acetyl-CoA carboxylase biotin carboxylase subunit [Blautia sp.]|nr:acetyl-CoA carboxylase biotin carboxylase subunit [Blautia sp.]